jgi:hypothetical protein
MVRAPTSEAVCGPPRASSRLPRRRLRPSLPQARGSEPFERIGQGVKHLASSRRRQLLTHASARRAGPQISRGHRRASSTRWPTSRQLRRSCSTAGISCYMGRTRSPGARRSAGSSAPTGCWSVPATRRTARGPAPDRPLLRPTTARSGRRDRSEWAARDGQSDVTVSSEPAAARSTPMPSTTTEPSRQHRDSPCFVTIRER